VSSFEGYELEVGRAREYLASRDSKHLSVPATWREDLVALCYAYDLPVTISASLAGVTLAYVRRYLRENHDPGLEQALEDARVGNFSSRVDHPRARDIKAPGIALAGIRAIQDGYNKQAGDVKDFGSIIQSMREERLKLDLTLRALDVSEAALREQNRGSSQKAPGILGLTDAVVIDEKEE